MAYPRSFFGGCDEIREEDLGARDTEREREGTIGERGKETRERERRMLLGGL